MKALLQEQLFVDFLQEQKIKKGLASLDVEVLNEALTERFYDYTQSINEMPPSLYYDLDVEKFVLKVIELEFLVPEEFAPDYSCPFQMHGFYTALLNTAASKLLITLYENFVARFVRIQEARIRSNTK